MYRRLLALSAFTAALCSFTALAADQPPAAPTLDTLAQIVAFARAHAWGPLAALAIGALVWAGKTDTAAKYVGRLPQKYRSLVALSLGVLSGILDQVTHGGAWAVAIGAGLTSASAAQMGHVLFIEILRGGREFGQPKPAAASPATTVTAVAFLALLLCGPMGPLGCQLPASYIGGIAACNGAYDACFDAAAVLSAPQPEKAAAFVACRAQIDAKCLGLLTPPPSATPALAPSIQASASASTVVSAAPSATPSAPPPDASSPVPAAPVAP